MLVLKDMISTFAVGWYVRFGLWAAVTFRETRLNPEVIQTLLKTVDHVMLGSYVIMADLSSVLSCLFISLLGFWFLSLSLFLYIGLTDV